MIIGQCSYRSLETKIKPNIDQFLTLFQAEYIVIDLSDTTQMTEVKKLSLQEVYNDGHFVIYKILKPTT